MLRDAKLTFGRIAARCAPGRSVSFAFYRFALSMVEGTMALR
jgi:hypothetical protein